MAKQVDNEKEQLEERVEPEGESPMEKLPPELMIHLAEYLPKCDRTALSMVNRKWCRVLMTEYRKRQQLIIEPWNLETIQMILKNTNEPFYHLVLKTMDIPDERKICWERHGPYLESLSLIQCTYNGKSLVNVLKYCSSLKCLKISSAWKTQSVVEALSDHSVQTDLSRSLQNLRILDLEGSTDMNDSLFKNLITVCGNLETLSLNKCRIVSQITIKWKSNFGYPQLSITQLLSCLRNQGKTLKHLYLNETGIDEISIISVCCINGLQLHTLKVGSSFSHLPREVIKFQSSLKVLDLSYTMKLRDADIACISTTLLTLEALNVTNCEKLTEVSGVHIATIKTLREMNISENGFAPESICYEAVTLGLRRELKFDKSVYNLVLDKLYIGKVPDNVFLKSQPKKVLNDICRSYQNLRLLDLGESRIIVKDDSIPAVFENMLKLRTLCLRRCIYLGDAGMLGILEQRQKKLPIRNPASLSVMRLPIVKETYGSDIVEKLESFSIDFSTAIMLSRLKHLEDLDISDCNRITDVTLTHAMILPKLRKLNLSGCTEITCLGFDHLTRNCPNIETLILTACFKVTDDVILCCAERLRRLSRFKIVACSRVSDCSLEYIKSFCHNLRYFDARCCGQISSKAILDLPARIKVWHNNHELVKPPMPTCFLSLMNPNEFHLSPWD